MSAGIKCRLIMKNFPFEHEGKTYWYSRSVACSMYLFVYVRCTHEWYILVSQRGPGCPNNVGKWNVPGGYLDFGETLEECARRECWEETGVDYNGKLTLASISTNPNSISQNVICSYYGEMEVERKDDLTCLFSKSHCEPDEVENIALWSVSDLILLPNTYHSKIAFGHDIMIKEIFKKRVQIPDWKWWLIEKIEKLTKIDLRIS